MGTRATRVCKRRSRSLPTTPSPAPRRTTGVCRALELDPWTGRPMHRFASTQQQCATHTLAPCDATGGVVSFSAAYTADMGHATNRTTELFINLADHLQACLTPLPIHVLLPLAWHLPRAVTPPPTLPRRPPAARRARVHADRNGGGRRHGRDRRWLLQRLRRDGRRVRPGVPRRLASGLLRPLEQQTRRIRYTILTRFPRGEHPHAGRSSTGSSRATGRSSRACCATATRTSTATSRASRASSAPPSWTPTTTPTTPPPTTTTTTTQVRVRTRAPKTTTAQMQVQVRARASTGRATRRARACAATRASSCMSTWTARSRRRRCSGSRSSGGWRSPGWTAACRRASTTSGRRCGRWARCGGIVGQGGRLGGDMAGHHGRHLKA